jgi:hypothetical protein
MKHPKRMSAMLAQSREPESAAGAANCHVRPSIRLLLTALLVAASSRFDIRVAGTPESGARTTSDEDLRPTDVQGSCDATHRSSAGPLSKLAMSA